MRRAHKDTRMNSRGCGGWPIENAYVHGPEFCATPLFTYSMMCVSGFGCLYSSAVQCEWIIEEGAWLLAAFFVWGLHSAGGRVPILCISPLLNCPPPPPGNPLFQYLFPQGASAPPACRFGWL